MAELAAYTNAPLYTGQATAASQARGLRVTLDSSGTLSASAIGVRGDYVSSQTVGASEFSAYFSLQGPGIIPMIADGAIAVGDAIYSAASGKVHNASGGGAILIGKANTAASGDGVLFEVVLGNPA